MKPVKVSMDSLMITLSRSCRSLYFLIWAVVIEKTSAATSQTARPASETQKSGSPVSRRRKVKSRAREESSMDAPMGTYMIKPGVVPSLALMGISMAFMPVLG